MRRALDLYFIHLLIYKKLSQEYTQKLLLGLMLFFVANIPACPVCFCNELGWPDHITVTYNVSSAENKAKNSYSVEILCAPLKEVHCGVWHDDTQEATEDNTHDSTHETKEAVTPADSAGDESQESKTLTTTQEVTQQDSSSNSTSESTNS